MFLFDLGIFFVETVSQSTNSKEILYRTFKGHITVIFNTVGGEISHQIQFSYRLKSRDSCV